MSAPGTSWQIMLADLAIILFLTTFSALAEDKPAPGAKQVATAPVIAEPVALWTPGDGAPPLGEWLKGQAFDGRMRVNVRGDYGPGDRAHVLDQASVISSDPALAGRAVRLILEPAATSAVTVTLSYDRV